MLPLAGRPNFAVTSGRFNPIQCPFNEYLAVDSGGDMYEQPSCINCCMYGWMFPREAEMVCD